VSSERRSECPKCRKDGLALLETLDRRIIPVAETFQFIALAFLCWARLAAKNR
jgi:hypothetical protein